MTASALPSPDHRDRDGESGTVGQLAERSRIPATTLRYYDSIGLLVPQRLQLVRVSRSLGLTLEEAAVSPEG